MDRLSISGIRLKQLLIVALLMLLSACQSAETRRAGGVIGSIAGSIGGSYLGHYVGGTAGQIVGAIAGGIGGYLGKDDKQKMAEASQRAYETEQQQTFSNAESGVSGKAEVVQASQQGDSRECKTIRQTAVLKDGKTVKEDIKSCKNGG
jgi:surface antigen